MSTRACTPTHAEVAEVETVNTDDVLKAQVIRKLRKLRKLIAKFRMFRIPVSPRARAVHANAEVGGLNDRSNQE